MPSAFEYEESRLSLAQARLAFLQLSVLLNSGISISRSLECLAVSPDREIALFAANTLQGISRGLPLSRAFAEATNSLTRTQLALVKSGETTGRLPFVLDRLAQHLGAERKLKQQLFSALTYPVGILIVAGFMALFMTNYMLPELVAVVGENPNHVPWPTRLLISLSEWGGALTVGFLSFVLSIPWLNSTVPIATTIRHWLLFESPIMGKLGKNSEMARIGEQLSLLLYSGLTLDRGLRMVTVEDPRLQGAIEKTLQGITRGLGLAEAMAETGAFGQEFIALIEVGEETGSLERALARQASYLRDELQRTLDETTKLIEPIALAVLGGVVGFIVVACFLPVYEIVAQSL